MNGFYSVCFLNRAVLDYPTVWDECDNLSDALVSAEEYVRITREREAVMPSIWVEIGDVHFELVEMKPGRPFKWDASLSHETFDEDGQPITSFGSVDDCHLWTRRQLAKFWEEAECGEHAADFSCSWDCDGRSADLVPLMRDRFGVVYQCRQCHRFTDSDCPPVTPLQPYRATRTTALA